MGCRDDPVMVQCPVVVGVARGSQSWDPPLRPLFGKTVKCGAVTGD